MYQDRIGGVTRTKVLRRANRTPQFRFNRAKLQRLVAGSPQVVIKITKRIDDAAQVGRHLSYITRNAKLNDPPAETELGKSIDKNELKKVTDDWNLNHGRITERTKLTINMVFSMPVDTDEKALHKSVREVAKKEFGKNYKYILAMHTPENDDKSNQPHVHLTVKTLGHDLKRLYLSPEDLARMRDEFAERLRANGVDAENTFRAERGVVLKGKNSAVAHIENRGKSKVRIDKEEEIKKEADGKKKNDRPWDKKIEERQKTIRHAYLEEAKALDAEGTHESKNLAAKVREFVKNMPKLVTERMMMAEELARNDKDKERGQIQKELNDE